MSDRRTWFKSSYSDSEGGDCIEVALDWRKFTHGDDEGSACIEVAPRPHTVHVRDSKLGGTSPALAVTAVAWTAFLGGVTR